MSSKSKAIKRLLEAGSDKGKKLSKEGITYADDILDPTALSTNVRPKRSSFLDADYDDEESFFKKIRDNAGKAAAAAGTIGGAYGVGKLLSEDEEEPSTGIKGDAIEEPTEEPKGKEVEDTSPPSTAKDQMQVPKPTVASAPQIEYDLEKELKEAEKPIDQSEEYGLIDEQYQQSLAQAYDAYQKTKDQQASAALWESIINGIGHLAAGVVGMQTGLDLGGVEFDKTDWQAKAAQNLAELREASSQARDVRIMAGDRLEKNYRRSLDQLQQNQKIKDRALEVTIANAKMKTEADKETQRRKEKFYDDLYRDAVFRMEQEKLAKEERDAEKLALLKKHGELEKQLGQLAKDASKDPKLARVYQAELQRYTNLSNQLGIENPAYSSVDFSQAPGFFGGINVDMQKSMIKRAARLKLLDEAPKAMIETYNYILKNPEGLSAKDRAKYMAEINKAYPGIFTGEI